MEDVDLKYARAFLRFPRRLDVMIEYYTEEIERTKDNVAKATAALSSDISRDPSPLKKERAIVRLLWLEDLLEALLASSVQARLDVMALLDQIEDPRELELIHKRYIQRLNWDLIAEEMGFDSTRSALRLHRDAMKSVVVLLSDRE